MYTETRAQLRQQALNHLPSLFHPDFGLKASGDSGRYANPFWRDAETSFMMAFPFKDNCTTELISAAIKIINVGAKYQGRTDNPQREERFGRIPHEVHDHTTPRARLEELERANWPIEVMPDGTKRICFYGAGDTTSGYISTVLLTGLAIEHHGNIGEADSFFRQYWPYVEAAIFHDLTLVRKDPLQLLGETPRNPNTLTIFSWKDSGSSYIDEDGNQPITPHRFLTNNCHYARMLNNASQIARRLNKPSFAEFLIQEYTAARYNIHRRFWDEKNQTYAPLIEGNGKQVHFIGDDSLEGLWNGIFEPEFAIRVIDRLMQPDMMTPWGIRTRSSESTQFKENEDGAYHKGCIWGHRTAIFSIATKKLRPDVSEVLDQAFTRYVRDFGFTELISVDRHGQPDSYRENGEPKSCLPQTWDVFGGLALTATE